MGLIFKCIRFLMRLIGRVVWGLAWSFVLSFMVIVGIFYFTTSTKPGTEGLTQAVQTAVGRVDQFLNHQGISTGLHSSEETQTDQLTDEHATTGLVGISQALQFISIQIMKPSVQPIRRPLILGIKQVPSPFKSSMTKTRRTLLRRR